MIFMGIRRQFIKKSSTILTARHTSNRRDRLRGFLWKDSYAKESSASETPTSNSKHLSPPPQLNDMTAPAPKTMMDSYSEIILPFKTDLHLREEYVNFYRGLR